MEALEKTGIQQNCSIRRWKVQKQSIRTGSCDRAEISSDMRGIIMRLTHINLMTTINMYPIGFLRLRRQLTKNSIGRLIGRLPMNSGKK